LQKFYTKILLKVFICVMIITKEDVKYS
jgi:hypothetical protein